jgi:hypothetical protein
MPFAMCTLDHLVSLLCVPEARAAHNVVLARTWIIEISFRVGSQKRKKRKENKRKAKQSALS